MFSTLHFVVYVVHATDIILVSISTYEVPDQQGPQEFGCCFLPPPWTER